MTKRLLGWIIILGLPLLGIAGFKKVKESFLSEHRDENISLKLYKATDYTAKVYDSTVAQIEITVEKVNGSNREQVWDTTLGPCLLRKYPSIEEALSKKIVVPRVSERKEHVEVKYLITYNTDGNILKVQCGPYILDDPNLQINL